MTEMFHMTNSMWIGSTMLTARLRAGQNSEKEEAP